MLQCKHLRVIWTQGVNGFVVLEAGRCSAIEPQIQLASPVISQRAPRLLFSWRSA